MIRAKYNHKTTTTNHMCKIKHTRKKNLTYQKNSWNVCICNVSCTCILLKHVTSIFEKMLKHSKTSMVSFRWGSWSSCENFYTLIRQQNEVDSAWYIRTSFGIDLSKKRWGAPNYAGRQAMNSLHSCHNLPHEYKLLAVTLADHKAHTH